MRQVFKQKPSSRLLKNSTACVIARMRSQNSDGSRCFASRAELSSALGEVEKCHEGIFQQAARGGRSKVGVGPLAVPFSIIGLSAVQLHDRSAVCMLRMLGRLY